MLVEWIYFVICVCLMTIVHQITNERWKKLAMYSIICFMIILMFFSGYVSLHVDEINREIQKKQKQINQMERIITV